MMFSIFFNSTCSYVCDSYPRALLCTFYIFYFFFKGITEFFSGWGTSIKWRTAWQKLFSGRTAPLSEYAACYEEFAYSAGMLAILMGQKLKQHNKISETNHKDLSRTFCKRTTNIPGMKRLSKCQNETQGALSGRRQIQRQIEGDNDTGLGE